jgi:hypothetical protein
MNWKDRDWTLIIMVVIGITVLIIMVLADRNTQLQEENTRLKAGMVAMDSLLTVYQTQLTACRADRDELGFAVVSMFRALPIQFTEVNYE